MITRENMNLQDSQQGSAMLELAFLMPIYMLMVFAIYYFGDISRIKFSAEESTAYYSQKEGIETPEDATATFFYKYGDDGEMEEFADADNELANITEGYIYDSLTTAAYEARTYYTVDGEGDMVPVTEEYYTLPINYGVFDQARNSSDTIADTINDWYSHGESRVNYDFDPYYLNLENVGMGEYKTNIQEEFYGAYKLTDFVRNLEGDPEPILEYLYGFEFNGSLEMPEPDLSKAEYWISR